MAETQNINDLSIAGFLESENKDNVTSLVAVPFQEIESIARLNKDDLIFNISLKNGSSVKLRLESVYQLCSIDGNKNRVQLSINDIKSINSFKLIKSEESEGQYPKPTRLQLDFYDKGKMVSPWERRNKETYTIIDHNIVKNANYENRSIGENQVWTPADSGRGCEKRLAGYGKRATAICYDFVNSGLRGPTMVVVPTGDEFNSNFAIGKYEITVGDYSKYCTISKSCAPEEKKEKFNNPITGISLDEAKTYAVWLSERTGKTYRLPTATEWEYAANAAGKQPKKDYNCRVVDDDKVIKGDEVVSIKSGQSNGWGLKNYVGNVQEWVIDGDSTKVRGGAYTDLHDECDISLSRPHSGDADDITGFRIFMEM